MVGKKGTNGRSGDLDLLTAAGRRLRVRGGPPGVRDGDDHGRVGVDGTAGLREAEGEGSIVRRGETTEEDGREGDEEKKTRRERRRRAKTHTGVASLVEVGGVASGLFLAGRGRSGSGGGSRRRSGRGRACRSGGGVGSGSSRGRRDGGDDVDGRRGRVRARARVGWHARGSGRRSARAARGEDVAVSPPAAVRTLPLSEGCRGEERRDEGQVSGSGPEIRA